MTDFQPVKVKQQIIASVNLFIETESEKCLRF